MMKTLALISCSLIFSMISCLRVLGWTPASLPSFRLLFRVLVLPGDSKTTQTHILFS